jgi:hypothetical protein
VTDMRLRQREAARQRRRAAQLAGRAARREEEILLGHQDGSDLSDEEYRVLLGDSGGFVPMTNADWERVRSPWSPAPIGARGAQSKPASLSPASQSTR